MSEEDDIVTEAGNNSDILQKELKSIQVAIAVGTVVIGLLLVVVIAAIVLFGGA